MTLVLQERGVDTLGMNAQKMREVLGSHEDFQSVLCIMLQRKRPSHDSEWGCEDDVLLIHYTERMDDVTQFISFGTMRVYMYDSAAGYGSITFVYFPLNSTVN